MDKLANKTFYIMRGIPGSGKSTKARELAAEHRVISADDFFMIDGQYRFDPTRLSDAHGSCFSRAIRLLERHGVTSRGGAAVIVIDNTNISNIEIAPYVLLAQAYGWEHRIVTLHTEHTSTVAKWAARNTHGVPIEIVMAKYEQLLRELAQTPPWWNQEILVEGETP